MVLDPLPGCNLSFVISVTSKVDILYLLLECVKNKF